MLVLSVASRLNLTSMHAGLLKLNHTVFRLPSVPIPFPATSPLHWQLGRRYSECLPSGWGRYFERHPSPQNTNMANDFPFAPRDDSAQSGITQLVPWSSNANV